MRARFMFTSVGVVVTAIIFGWLVAGAVHAQAPTPTPEREIAPNPFGYQIFKDEKEQYLEAVKDCSTPSLECLVHNVARFTAIEWVYEISGPQSSCQPGETGPECLESTENSIPADSSGSSLPSSVPVAQGAIGGIGKLISAMYQHPVANTGTYVADVLNSAHIATPAYAQGLGFAALDPILVLWKTFRNIAYLFFVIIFVIIGFMIMFRQKMGNAAITAQQAIPNILTALIFVTFSYAIAGLLIDMMYVLMILIIGVFGETFQEAGQNVNILTFNILNLVGVMFRGVARVGNNVDIISSLLEGLGVSGFLNTLTSLLGGLTLTLVLAIAVLIGAVKLFFELLRSYATVVLSVVTAPIVLMMGAIPGKNVFMPWIKTIAGNLLPFPTVLLVLVMYYKFTDGTIREGGGFMPPFLLGGGQGGTIVAIMGLAIILALPEIVKKVRDSVAPKGGIGEFITDAGVKAAKNAWSGKVPGGFNAKNMFTRTAKTPLAVAGGYLGYKYADNKANELGLEGRARNIARAGGILGGASIAPNMFGIVRRRGGEFVSQLGQAQATKFVQDIETASKRRRGQAASQTNTDIAATETTVTAAPTATTTRGSSGADPSTQGL